MTKVNRRASKGVTGVAFVVLFMFLALVCTTISTWPAANAQAKKKTASGTATITINSGKVTVDFTNLKNLAAGTHAVHLHRGACPVKFAQGVPHALDAKNIVVLGTFTNTKNDTKESLSANLPSGDKTLGGKWFLCVHTGPLADVTSAKILAQDIKNGDKEIPELICVDIKPVAGNSEILNFTKPATK